MALKVIIYIYTIAHTSMHACMHTHKHIHTHTHTCMHACMPTYTVWHKNFTWNLILWFYDQWQNCKIKIHKLDENLLYIAMTSSKL